MPRPRSPGGAGRRRPGQRFDFQNERATSSPEQRRAQALVPIDRGTDVERAREVDQALSLILDGLHSNLERTFVEWPTAMIAAHLIVRDIETALLNLVRRFTADELEDALLRRRWRRVPS
jgi:hypothetical protein